MRSVKYFVDESILEAVDIGLSGVRKSLPSWLLYDARGNQLFQSIMRMPQYYPTQCEAEILRKYNELLVGYFSYGNEEFELIELGAGDGTKTEILLSSMITLGLKFVYRPVDVSNEVLNELSARIKRKLPEINIDPIARKYDDVSWAFSTSVKKVLLFLGANIGNYSQPEANDFIRSLSGIMNVGDQLMIGVDLKKDPRTILLAYDDPNGITREFNLNLLRRLNYELGAEFHIGRFTHYPTYNPVTGTAESFLVSLHNQDVYIDALNKTFHFSLWETIHTEISQKYDLTMINEMISYSGLQLADMLYDSKKYFCDILLVK